MAQCMYLDARGRRCRLQAGEGTPFCPEHGGESVAAGWSGVNLRRLLLRLTALLLLLILLVPLAVEGYRLLELLLN